MEEFENAFMNLLMNTRISLDFVKSLNNLAASITPIETANTLKTFKKEQLYLINYGKSDVHYIGNRFNLDLCNRNNYVFRITIKDSGNYKYGIYIFYYGITIDIDITRDGRFINKLHLPEEECSELTIKDMLKCKSVKAASKI